MPTNRLAGETSPYLLQHAHNPVDWYPWGEEALARAHDLDRPIFLSIGYAACHWCHVMERESFEDEATAAQLNAGFVSIKVDREERPDLDGIYMQAVQELSGGHGGWPMSVFLTPDGRPFYGGTYFPPERRHGMPAFRDVLEGVRRAWADRRGEIETAGTKLAEWIARTGAVRAGDAPLEAGVLAIAEVALDRAFDEATGGWGGAPKFPQPMAIEFLLHRAAAGSSRALAIARRALDRMAAGGIHDQLGGGFHRYATDAVWLVPHFEKMLYDNAQLARAYLHAYQATGEPRYREVAIRTIEYIERELLVGRGGFAASQDADTEGEEGSTYVWTADEIAEALRAAGLEDTVGLAIDAWGIVPGGNWEGRTILQRVRGDDVLAARAGRPTAEIADRLEAARAALLAARGIRPQPARDDKVLAAWNGLVLAAIAEASTVLDAEDDPRGARFRALAEDVAGALLGSLRGPDGRLRRSWKDGRAAHAGQLEDHACLAEGLLALHGATLDERWFVAARDLMDEVLARFADPGGGFFDTADDQPTPVTRPKALQDNATPSGNAMAATVLLRLAALTGDERYAPAAERTLALVGPLAGRHPTAFAQWLVAMDLALGGITELAIAGGAGAPDTRALLAVARRGFRPRLAVAASADPDSSAVPLLHGRSRIDGRATAYVCRDFACRRPTTDPADLERQLAG